VLIVGDGIGGLAGGGDRGHRLACDRQPAGSLPPCARVQPLSMLVKGGSVETLRSFLLGFERR